MDSVLKTLASQNFGETLDNKSLSRHFSVDYGCKFLLIICILTCPSCSPKYCMTRNNIQRYYTLKWLIRYTYSTQPSYRALRSYSRQKLVSVFSMAWYKIVTQHFLVVYLTIILRNRAEYRLILSRRGRRPSWLKSDDIPQDWAG